jgi:hypothetical protein
MMTWVKLDATKRTRSRMSWRGPPDRLQSLHSYKEAELEGAGVLRRDLGGRMKANQTFRPLARFLRAG